MARTRVTLEAVRGSLDASTTALSDSSGRFTFSGLSSGVYLLSARKAGYSALRLGQKQGNGPGTPIVLDENSVFSTLLKMKRLGAVSGEILDENQLGLPGVSVYAYHAGPRLRLAATGVSNDRGAYRISGLEPGRYYVRTAPIELEGGRGLLPTFFGQAVTRNEARIVEARLDEESAGVNLEPLPGRLASLDGVVLGASASSVTLFGDEVKREAAVGPGGTFLFEGLAPGSYEVMAQAESLVAYQKLYVAGPRETVQLQLSAPPFVRIACEERSGKAMDARQISIFVKRREGASDANPQRLACGQPASLAPGRWELAAAAPPHLYVSAILNAERGTDAYEFTLSDRREHRMTILFGSAPAGVHGKVVTADGQAAIGAPVYLYALEDDTRTRSGGVRTVRADQDGVFRIAGLPPGRYEVLSSFQVSDASPSGWPAGRGLSVNLEEGASKAFDLQIVEFDH